MTAERFLARGGAREPDSQTLACYHGSVGQESPRLGRLDKSVRSGPEDVRTGLASHLTRLWRYGLVLSRSRETAHDLVQATCVRALERAPQFAAGTRLDRWLLSILRSIWLNEVRASRVRRGLGLVDAEAVLTLDGVAQMESSVLTRQVLANVSQLPEPQREALLLVYAEGLSYRDAAAFLDVPVGTVQSRLAAARAALAGLSDRETESRT
jgi:RNA polymerase sigma-70 factor (ECF subfamily)